MLLPIIAGIDINSCDSICPYSLRELKDHLTKPQIVDFHEGESVCKKILEIDIKKLPDTTKNILSEIKKYGQSVICGVKLYPLYHARDFDAISALLLKYEIKFITCAARNMKNSHQIMLLNISSFYQRLKNRVDIIAGGHVESGYEAFEYILFGAAAVQSNQNIRDELIRIMEKRGYKKISEFRGRLKLYGSSL